MGGITLEAYNAVEAATWLICCVCGTQFPTTDRQARKTCHICDDERQYVPPSGQSFTTLGDISQTRRNVFTPYEADPRLTFIRTEPQFAIGQRAILIRTPAGNVLWDCITLLDHETIARIAGEGGLRAIVISHPHFYSTHVQWARAFGCPVYLASDDTVWTALSSTHQVPLTETETAIADTGVRAIKVGGHFPGSLVALFDGHLLHADTMMTTRTGLAKWAPGKRPRAANAFSYMWSYPNMIPLAADELARMWGVLRRYEFRATHGGFEGQDVEDGEVKERMLDSMKIQVKHMGHTQHALLSVEL